MQANMIRTGTVANRNWFCSIGMYDVVRYARLSPKVAMPNIGFAGSAGSFDEDLALLAEEEMRKVW